MRFLVFIASLIFSLGISMSASAASLKVLFIGNSFTFNPGTEDAPTLPALFRELVQAGNKDLKIEVDFRVMAGHTMKMHKEEGVAAKMIRAKKYDFVILQGYSVEALELTSWFHDQGIGGRPEFIKYMKEFISMVEDSGAQPILMSTWIYAPDHALRQEAFDGLRFPMGQRHAGEKWTGNTDREYLDKLEEGYALAAKGTSARIVWVGEAWMQGFADLSHPVAENDFYQPDHAHPLMTGAYLSACALYRAILKKSPEGNVFHPTEVPVEKALFLQRLANAVLAPRPLSPHLEAEPATAVVSEPEPDLTK